MGRYTMKFITLRNYQADCVTAVKEDVINGENALCVLPVGSGKTVILSAIVKKLSGEFLILVNKSILIKQISDTLGKFDIVPSIYSASLGKKDIGKVTIATIQSFVNCKEKYNFSYIIVDEAHRFDFDFGQVSKVSGVTSIIGFTATPFTANGPIYGKDKIFKHKTYTRTIREMTEQGYLVPLMYRACNKKAEIDLKNVKKRKDDYVLKDLQNAFISNEEKVKLQVSDALEKSSVYEKILVVTTGIAHCEMVYSHLENASIIHSKLSKEERNYNMELFTNGDNRFLVSVLIVSEGFDFPPAQVLWLMRPTRSPVLYMQAAGRVLRNYTNKTHAVLLDYGGTVPELGSIYDLNEGKGTEKLKLCVECETYNKQNAKKCYRCNEHFEVLCQTCLKMKKYGVVCCTEEDKKKRNALANLTLQASKGDWITITDKKIYNYTAKSGRFLPRVDYYNGFKLVVSEFFFKMKIETVRKIIYPVKKIKVRLNANGYKEVCDKTTLD